MRILVASVEFVPVEFTASVALGGQVVRIRIKNDDFDDLWTASWAGAESYQFTIRDRNGEPATRYRRDARVLIGPGGAPSVAAYPVGTYQVNGKLTDSPEIPELPAFLLSIVER